MQIERYKIRLWIIRIIILICDHRAAVMTSPVVQEDLVQPLNNRLKCFEISCHYCTVGESVVFPFLAAIAGMIAEPDICQPRLQSVTVPPDPDVRVLYWPTCTMVMQCGGCCGHEMHVCAPTQLQSKDVSVNTHTSRNRKETFSRTCT